MGALSSKYGIRIKILNNIKHLYATCLKFGDRFFTSITMSGLEVKASILRSNTTSKITSFSVPIPRQKSRLSHVNIILRHYGGQLKTAVEQEAGEKIDCKR